MRELINKLSEEGIKPAHGDTNVAITLWALEVGGVIEFVSLKLDPVKLQFEYIHQKDRSARIVKINALGDVVQSWKDGDVK